MRLVIGFICLSFLPNVLFPCARAGAPAPEVKPAIVSFRSGKDTIRALQYRPAGNGPFPAIVVVHGEFGLTDQIKDHALRLARRLSAASHAALVSAS